MSEDKQVRVKAEIMSAKYHPLEKTLMVSVKLPNGQLRSVVQFAKNFKYHGRAYEEVPAEEIDREMEKTAELYRKAKGRKIPVQLYENQIIG